jgi:hypothetical protein
MRCSQVNKRRTLKQVREYEALLEKGEVHVEKTIN